MFLKEPQKVNLYFGNLRKKYAPRTFEKSPNLVTLIVSQRRFPSQLADPIMIYGRWVILHSLGQILQN